MPQRARSVAVVATLVGGLVVAGTTPASARPIDCTDIAGVRAAKLQSCIADLRTDAEAAGKRAAKADEAYLQAKQATARARKQLAAADAAAQQAAAVAARSRTRAAAVTANLARGGGTVGQTAEVLLSGKGATSVLYHLSRMSELGSDSSRVARDAARDARTAAVLEAQAGQAAEHLADSERRAKLAFTAAKHESDSARLLVVQAEVKQGGTDTEGKIKYVDLPADAPTAAKVVAFARAQIGEPYVFGGAGPRSWDCSGLSMMAFEAVGKSIGGHSSNAQYHLAASKGLLVPYSAAQPGDLVFYGSGDMYHVAIYSGGGNMIEAPYPGKSVREVPVRGGDRAAMVARFTG